MSWSLSLGEVADFEDVTVKAAAALDAQQAAGSKLYDDADVEAQVHEAVRAARNLVASGALGDGPWFVNLSGHVNPGHAPRAGWANDSVSINVSQAARPA